MQLDEYPDLIIRVQQPSPLEERREYLGGKPRDENARRAYYVAFYRNCSKQPIFRDQFLAKGI